MKKPHLVVLLVGLALCQAVVPANATDLPPPADRAVSFGADIAPLFQKSCVKCHAKGNDKGGFSLESRDAFLRGGDSGPAAEVGNSSSSLVVELVAGLDPNDVMPKKGSRWTAEQVSLLRAWIDQGVEWDDNVSFARPPALNLHPRAVKLPEEGSEQHPLDQLLAVYLNEKSVSFQEPIPDAQFARRAYLDIIGLLPTPEELDDFLRNTVPDKRSALTRSLLANQREYAAHWLTFWNDLLRNDYKGTGFIDGGRRQISGWLYNALLTNKPYDQFVRELVDPKRETEGFTAGILWRGNVNASMTRPMQAAQNISQVFLGVNLKCASCHDSFISDWTLADAYGLAAIYSESPLELVHCDKPTGKQAALRFLYPQLGELDPVATKEDRLRKFAGLMTGSKNGRLPRTIVNRLWARLLGRGLVEPVDDMEQPAWNADILDWLAEDLVAHGYDLKRTIEMIVTSRAYQLPIAAHPRENESYVFTGPLSRRMTAEQFSDGLSSLVDCWEELPSTLEFDLGTGSDSGQIRIPEWIWTSEPVALAGQRIAARAAKAKAEDAREKAFRAYTLVEANGGKADEAVREAALAASESARAAVAVAGAAQSEQRHRVIFRKRIDLGEKPDRAFATLLASQHYDLLVNGELVRPKLVDDHRHGRIRLYDLARHLRPGGNLIVVSVESHTDKGLSDSERPHYPKAHKHLNTTSGMAFYARCVSNSRWLEIVSDASWRVRRAPGGDWGGLDLSESEWTAAAVLPPGMAPVDEGPGLEPIRRRDFANQPVELGPMLRPAVSTAASSGRVRAAFRAADSLALAMDRPNREQITTVRSNVSTTLQALELTNGATLDNRLRVAAERHIAVAASDPQVWTQSLYLHAVGRIPSSSESALLQEMLAEPVQPEGVADVLWTVLMLPEFQLIN